MSAKGGCAHDEGYLSLDSAPPYRVCLACGQIWDDDGEKLGLYPPIVRDPAVNSTTTAREAWAKAFAPASVEGAREGGR